MSRFIKVSLLGNLPRDPALRYTPKGTAVAKMDALKDAGVNVVSNPTKIGNAIKKVI